MGLLKSFRSSSSSPPSRHRALTPHPSSISTQRTAPPQIITSSASSGSARITQTGGGGQLGSSGSRPNPSSSLPLSNLVDHHSISIGPVQPVLADSAQPQPQPASLPHRQAFLGVQSKSAEDLWRRVRRRSHSDLHGSSQLSSQFLPPASDRGGDSPPPPSIRSGLPPTTFKDLAVLYQVVAERRTAFDNLLWQVPATSLTAHAFLFSISLAADTGRFARIASMGLCIVITVLTLHLFTRQLQAEDADHRWLADFEERHQIDYYDRAHGTRWKDYRAQKPAGAGRLGWLAMHRSYPLWSKGMIIIAVLAFTILILAIFDQSALLGHNCQSP